jgi:phosphatidylglycerophosphate synthase
VPSPGVVFITAEPGSPAPDWRLGGLTVLERRLLEAQRRGAERAVIGCAGTVPERPWTIAIERAAEPPAGAEVVRADEVAGIRLDSPAALRRAEWAHLRTLPKSFQGPIDALINRHVSLRITRVLARTPITPNLVTTTALIVGLVAAGLLPLRSYWAIAVAGVLMELQSIIDSCDGELARLRFQFSRAGAWLDNVADDITDAALMVGLGLAAGGRTWMWLGIGAGIARGFTQLVLYVNVRRLGGDFLKFRWWFETDVATVDQVYDLRSPLAWVRSLGRRDVYLFLWGGLCVAALPEAAAGYAVVISGVYTAMTVIHLVVNRR